MKHFLFALVILGSAIQAQATVDGHTKAFIVVQDINAEELFFVERVSLIGCWGLAQGPQLAQFTSEYIVNSNMGCSSDQSFKQNINYLICAKVVRAKESSDYSSYEEIELDISKCEAKENPKFISAVQNAAKLNFPQKKSSLKLKLIK